MSCHFALLYRRTSIIPVFLFVTAITWILECSAADTPAVKSLLEIRRENVVIQEWDLSCGAAALATILRYQHGDPVSEKAIARALIARGEYMENPELIKIRQGFSLLDLKRYVDSRGYRGVGYGKMTIAELVEKAPVMLPISFFGYNHFVIFRGVMGDRVLLADPAWGMRTISLVNFQSAWIDYGEAMGKVGFIVERQNAKISSNQLSPKASDFVMLR